MADADLWLPDGYLLTVVMCESKLPDRTPEILWFSLLWSRSGPCLGIMGRGKVAITARAAKIQLQFLTYFSKRSMFLALHDKDFPVPYLTGQLPSSSPRVVENSARCAMGSRAHKGTLFQASQSLVKEKGLVVLSVACWLAR